jgi:signal transduction histidine kinase/ActR/RegA family two-component response regulator
MHEVPHSAFRVLVIDDNKSIHEDFRKILAGARQTGELDSIEAAVFGESTPQTALPEFEIDSAYQGREGLELIEKSLREKRPYTMAFVDVRMPPGWDGIETTSKIWEKYSDLQVVICTAYSDYSWQEIVQKLGYSDRLVILKKPFDNIEALQLAISLSEKWRLYQQAKFRLGDLENLVHERTLVLEDTNAKLARANEQLLVATEKAQKMAEAALVASKAKGEFLANMSHEIRTPMNGVVGMVELLMQTPMTPEQEDCCNTIKASADALLCIINDILDFSKIEAGKLTFEKIEFNLQDTVKATVDLLMPKAKEKMLDLNFHFSPDTEANLVGDPTRLRQILLNLLGNGIKFTSRGNVSLAIRQIRQLGQEVELQFDVTDTGIGLSDEARARIFHSFTQADASTTRRYGGTGLGLAICRRLVELMGGSMRVSSALGQGSTFTFSARFGHGPKPAPALTETGVNPSEPPHRNPEPASSHPEIKILLAEDNPINQVVAGKQLRRFGYTVDVVNNGVDAVQAWERNHYRIILMDCQMPQMDGYEATRKIRELEAEQHLPPARIIALTAHAMTGDRELCLATGMNDYLAKPVDSDHLKTALAKAEQELGRPSSNRATPVK